MMDFGTHLRTQKTKMVFTNWLAQTNQNQGLTASPTIISSAHESSKLIVNLFNSSWVELANGKSVIFSATCQVALLFAASIVIFWGLGWYSEIVNRGFTIKTVDELIYPILVALMLGVNNGALLADTSLLFRGISNFMNDKILLVTLNNINIKEAIREVNMNGEFQRVLGEKVKQCETLSDTDKNGKDTTPHSDCITRAIAEVKQAATQYQQKTGLLNIKIETDVGKIIGTAINAAGSTVLLILFTTLEAGFQFFIQISFLLNAYIAPVFVALSLLPLGSKPIYAWLSGWLALGLTQVSYTIVVGMAASTIINADTSNPLLLPLMEGVLSPILALAMGAGGGMAIFTSLTSVASAVAGKD